MKHPLRAGALGRPLFLVLLCALPAAAQSPGVRVERRGPAMVAVSPGGTATVVFRVSGSGTGAARAATRAELPAGWRLLSGGGEVELAPGGAEARLVGFAVPGAAPAGSYRVRFAATAGGGESRDSVAVVVRERRRLELRLLEAPELAAAGDPYTSVFLLANRGNVPARVRLRAVSGNGFAARVDTLPLALAPGEERTLPVRVLTLRALDRAVRHPLELRAGDPADSAGAVTASSAVEVVPRPARAPRYHRFPVAVTVHAASAGSGGIPAEAAGSGALLPGGRLRLDFLARGAADPFLGLRPEYRAALSGRGFELRLGDQLWVLSPLAGGMRPGRGAGGALAAGRWTASGFARRGAPGAPDEAEDAASLALRVGGSGRVEAGAFRRSGPGAGAGWTVRAAAPLPGARLEAEYGTGGKGGEAGSARFLLLHGGGARLSYTLRHLRAGEGFPWRDGYARQDFAALALRPAGGLHLDAAFDRHAGGRADFPGFAAPPDGWSLRAGAGYGGVVTVRLEQRGVGEAARYAGATRSAEVRLGLGRGPLRLHPLLQVGRVADGVAGGERPFRRWALHSALSGRAGSLSAHLDRLEGAVPGRAGARGGTEAALDASARMGTAGELRASLRAVRYGGDVPWSEVFLDAGAERRLPRGHRIAAGVRLSRERAGAAPRNLFRLDYTVPLGVPVAPSGEGGRVVGRVFDAETGAPLAGARVTLGDRTVLTDAAGRLAFAGLPPATYPLRVEGRGPGAGRVTLDRAPVVLGPGRREVRVEVGVVRSARLRGVARIVAGADSTGVAGVVVELARGGEVLRRVSGADGGFDFADLRPGRWTLSVVGADLPLHHRFERDAAEVELAPGEAGELALRVLPVRRPVRMLTRGEVVVEAPRQGGGKP